MEVVCVYRPVGLDGPMMSPLETWEAWCDLLVLGGFQAVEDSFASAVDEAVFYGGGIER